MSEKRVSEGVRVELTPSTKRAVKALESIESNPFLGSESKAQAKNVLRRKRKTEAAATETKRSLTKQKKNQGSPGSGERY